MIPSRLLLLLGVLGDDPAGVAGSTPVVVVEIDHGVGYRARDCRPHFAAHSDLPHYAAEPSRPHFAARRKSR